MPRANAVARARVHGPHGCYACVGMCCAQVPEFMRRFWGAGPSTACGFKLLNAQIRPMDKVPQIFTVAGHPDGAVMPSPVPVKRVLLERADIAGEFESWRRAQSIRSQTMRK